MTLHHVDCFYFLFLLFDSVTHKCYIICNMRYILLFFTCFCYILY